MQGLGIEFSKPEFAGFIRESQSHRKGKVKS